MSDPTDPTDGVSNSAATGDNTVAPHKQLASVGSVDLRREFMKTDPRMIAQRGRWRKGDDGIPKMGGKPKSLPGFRKHCREDAEKVRKEIMRRIEADSQGTIPIKELVQAFTELSDRGGFMKPKEEADIETAKARMVLAAMALKDLNAEQRAALLTAIEGAF